MKIIYSIVIPVYNSGKVLFELSERIVRVFNKEIKKSYEMIFIDDGSDDIETWACLRDIYEQGKNIKIIKLTRNFGQHAATLCGMEEAEGKYIITMDDDLQHLPEDIPLLISKIDHDIVLARFKRKKHSFLKVITSKIKGFFDRIILGKPKSILLTSFRLIKREIIEGMLKINTPYPFLPALMFYATHDIVNVDVEHGQRKSGRSGYGLKKLIKMFSNLIINNSSYLLRLIGTLGIGISFISFILIIYLVIRKLIFNIGLLGWTSVMVSIIFFGGLILFSLGIIGEYLIRIIRTSESKPTYLIREKLDNK